MQCTYLPEKTLANLRRGKRGLTLKSIALLPYPEFLDNITPNTKLIRNVYSHSILKRRNTTSKLNRKQQKIIASPYITQKTEGIVGKGVRDTLQNSYIL